MKRCGNCGGKVFERRSLKGRVYPYKDHLRVPLLYDYSVQVCTECNAEVLSNKDVWELNELLEASVKGLAKKSIEDLVASGGVLQKDVARMIGQTPEYISMLKSGAKAPRASTLALLRIYAKHPSVMEEFTGFRSKVLEIPAATTAAEFQKDEMLNWRVFFGSGLSVQVRENEENCVVAGSNPYQVDVKPLHHINPNQLASYSSRIGK